MRFSLSSLAVLVTAPLVLGGCVSEYARERAASELGCPVEDVHVRRAAFQMYEAEGCGRSAVYACPRGYHGPLCMRESPVYASDEPLTAALPRSRRPMTALESGPAKSIAAQAATDAAAACRDEAGPHGAGGARVTFQPDGAVTSVVLDERFDGSRTGACMSSRLRAMRIPGFAGSEDSVDVPFFLAGAGE